MTSISGPSLPTDSARRLELGMVLYPGLSMLDVIAPQAVLGFHCNSHFIAETLAPVPADLGGALVPTTTFADAPHNLDIIFVPGGAGTTAAMQNAQLLEFVAKHGKTAQYVTSVCSGAVILAAAGLLRGYRAATHWASYAGLAAFEGVFPVHERVVIDGNRVTGGGVTAGLDFGLSLLAHMQGDTVARMTQLMLEYDPAPPFQAGNPVDAGPELAAQVMQLMDRDVREMQRIAAGSQHGG